MSRNRRQDQPHLPAHHPGRWSGSVIRNLNRSIRNRYGSSLRHPSHRFQSGQRPRLRRRLAALLQRTARCHRPATDTQAIVRDCGNAIVVAFRGTTNVRDFITDAEAWRRNIEDCQIHYGFYRALVSINDELTAHLAALPARPLFITGHSLGGALALLFAFRLVLPPFPIHGVYTFGQPRVGNRNFAALYDRFQPPTPSASSTSRTSSRIPGVLSGYQHAARKSFCRPSAA